MLTGVSRDVKDGSVGSNKPLADWLTPATDEWGKRSQLGKRTALDWPPKAVEELYRLTPHSRR
jgi:hypothetical protein